MVQKDLGDKRAPWMTTLQEYDLEIKNSTMVRGKGLCKLATESSHSPVNNFDINTDESFLKKEIHFFPPPQDSWYFDM